MFAEDKPLDALLALMKSNEPSLRAAALTRLTMLNPLPLDILNVLNDAMRDVFSEIRKILPEAIMRAYPVDPPRARSLLSTLFTDRLRDVRIEVIEHLELLAKWDWSAVFIYLERASHSDERNTRRAVLRKIEHLLRDFAGEIKNAQDTLGETFFKIAPACCPGSTLSLGQTRDWQGAGRFSYAFMVSYATERILY